MKHEKELYNQTQIANLLGISKATVSRYLNKLNVSAITENNSKFYTETTLKQLKKLLKSSNTKQKDHVPTISLLQDQISQLKLENSTLRDQLKIKDEQIKALTNLADHAQQLNALDKKELQKPPHKKHWWQKKD